MPFGDRLGWAAKRSKEDLHEWSIYRQNLTSSLANDLWHVPGSIDHETRVLPYGDFHMNDQAIQGVVRAARLEDNQLSDKTDTYIKFGLPRVAIHGQSGDYTLQRPLPFRASARTCGDRKTQSNWDLAADRTGVDTEFDQECATLRDGGMTSMLNSPVVHYAESDIFPTLRQQRPSSFFQSDRHHAHYFSNVDLFQQPSGFNYLRYAKAEELHREDSSSKCCARISNLTFKTDDSSLMDRIMLRSANYQNSITDVTLELIGGEVVALLYTTEAEMRTLLHVIAQKNAPRGKVEGAFEINGNRLSATQFGERVTIVDSDEPFPLLTVKETLKISSAIVKPATDAFKVDSMIDQLIQTLALAPYRNILCEQLGQTEKQRLKIAEQILKDTDILVCDNITKDMDLYDTAFVVDYLRDWAVKLNRIVLMAVTPPTFEILTMFNKTVLLSSGQVMYHGRSSGMIGYFESVEFPCPMFKNPCDYYVDLVTHDHLTSDASAESKDRIKHLAGLWRRKAPAAEQFAVLEPVSPPLRHANCFSIALVVFTRFARILRNRPSEYLNEILFSLVASIMMGAIFFEIPADRRASINDRFGFIFSLLTVILLPNLLTNINRVHRDRLLVHGDLRCRYYDPNCYLLMKLAFDFPIAVVSYALYSLPAYLLSDLPPDSRFWPSVIALVLTVTIYGLLWRYISWIIAFLFPSRLMAALCIVSLMSFCALGSGLVVHPNDSSPACNQFRSWNPTAWTAQIIAENDFIRTTPVLDKITELISGGRAQNATELLIGCERKRILATKIKEVPIYTVSQCYTTRGSQALAFSGFAADKQHINSRFVTAIEYFCFYFIIVFALLFLAVRVNHKPENTTSGF